MKTVLMTIKESQENVRIDRLLAELPEIHSRSRAEKLITAGHVTFEGETVKPSRLAKAGEVYQISIPEADTTPNLKPYELQLDFVYEDDDLLVVNKPAGLVMHPAFGHAGDTLVNALVFHQRNLSMGFGDIRPGIVHRLDRPTSGLLVIAKNDWTHERLAQQFRERTIHRIYWAICYGKFKQTTQVIESNIGRHPKDRKKFASLDDGRGKIAVTTCQVIATSPTGLSWARLKLGTGRTHQIRVHLSEHGHPIVGDTLYGGRIPRAVHSDRLRKTIQSLSRIALHATELGFVHPRSGEKLSFSTPWPADLQDFVKLAGFEENQT